MNKKSLLIVAAVILVVLAAALAWNFFGNQSGVSAGAEAVIRAAATGPNTDLFDMAAMLQISSANEEERAAAQEASEKQMENWQTAVGAYFAEGALEPVSYTHLDVYKRQGKMLPKPAGCDPNRIVFFQPLVVTRFDGLKYLSFVICQTNRKIRLCDSAVPVCVQIFKRSIREKHGPDMEYVCKKVVSFKNSLLRTAKIPAHIDHRASAAQLPVENFFHIAARKT